jgi:hypothetical protein
MERSNSQFRWALTEESVKLACSNVYKITDIIKTIEKMTGISLSSEWQRKLKAWGKYYGEGYTVQVRLIRLENGHILSELRTIDRNLNAWLHPLPESEGIAVVSEVHLQDALALLALYGVHVREANWW